MLLRWQRTAGQVWQKALSRLFRRSLAAIVMPAFEHQQTGPSHFRDY
jgi:hypothetical protein